MVLTPEQVAQLVQIIRDGSTALAVSTAAYELPPDELARLKQEGFLDPDGGQNIVLDSFAFGQLLQHQPRAKQMSFQEFSQWLARHPVALTPTERASYQVASRRAGQFCTGLGNRYSDELGRLLVNADQELAARTRQIIQDAVARKVEERQTVRQLKSELGRLTGDWARDWDRIAATESHLAQQEGFLHAVTAEYGEDELLAKIPEPKACPHCRAHYLEDGRPMVKPASWWHAQGASNVGRRQADWKPVLGAMHPWCRCQLVRVPAGWGFDAGWNLVPADQAEKSWREVALAKATQLPLWGGASTTKRPHHDWQPIPHTIHPGGERRRTGKGWEYRYPQPSGGYAPAPHQPELPLSPLPPRTPVVELKPGPALELPWDANPARRRRLLIDARDRAWQAMEFHADNREQQRAAEQSYPPEAKRLSEFHSRKELDAFADRISVELESLSKYKGLNPRVLDPDFKAWFGDWEKGESSKVLKAGGEPAEMWGSKPIPVFHGTPLGGFRYFDKGKDKGYNIFGKGFYFTEDQGIAEEYIRKDADDAAAGITHYVDSRTKAEIRNLWPDDTIRLLRVGTRPTNPNWGPAIAWAVIRAEEPTGVNLRKLIQEYWEPTGMDDPQVVAHVMARIEELDPDAVKSFTWNGRYLHEHFAELKSKFAGTHGTAIYGAKLLHAAIQERAKGAVGIGPKPEVFECYLNIRNPIDMDRPVDKVALKQLGRYLLRNDISRHQVELARLEQEAEATKDPRKYRHALAVAGAAQHKKEIAELEQQQVGHAYADDLIDSTIKGMGLPGIHGDNIEVAYEPLLRLKQHLVKTTKGIKSSSGHQALGLLHISDPGVLTWGDVHYIMTNAHGGETEKRRFRAWAEQAGYDGMGHTGGWNVGKKAHRVWIAWEPTQIKSTQAVAFDPTDPDIYKAGHQLYLGPRGGKWADPRHTQSWHPEVAGPVHPPALPEPKPVRHLTVLQNVAERARDPKEWNLPAGARHDPWAPKPVDPEATWSHPDYGTGKGPAPWQQPGDWHPDFNRYDYILINSSAGKDSQAMLSHVVGQARAAGYPLSKLVVVHADLGRVEWEGTRDLARQQAEHYGLRFEVVKRHQNDLIEQIEERHGDLLQREADVAALREGGVKNWADLAAASPDRILSFIGAGQGSSKWEGKHRVKELQRKAQNVLAKPTKKRGPTAAVDFGKVIAWPSANARYCTSDHKRAEVMKLMTKLAAEHTGSGPAHILNALGIRAQESSSRAAMPSFSREEATGERVVDRWYPIHQWAEDRVWGEIQTSGLPVHKAYSLGMRRLSCAFCVFASKADLMIAAIHNPKLFQTYLDLEQRVGASFKQDQSLAEIRDEIQRRRNEGYNLNELAQWVKKALQLDGLPDSLVKSELAQPEPSLIGLVLEAALIRLRRHGAVPATLVVDWKVEGACFHLDTDQDSHHVAYLPYPAAYNASLLAAAIAQRHGLGFEENNVPAPMEGGEMAKSYQDQLPGGRADRKRPADFPADKLRAGTDHELEHTHSRALAREIAMDHLVEDPDYYRKLKRVEKGGRLLLLGGVPLLKAEQLGMLGVPSKRGRGDWQPIPHTIHPGGQRKRGAGGWEYRYPQPAGGYAPTPHQAELGFKPAAPAKIERDFNFPLAGAVEWTFPVRNMAAKLKAQGAWPSPPREGLPFVYLSATKPDIPGTISRQIDDPSFPKEVSPELDDLWGVFTYDRLSLDQVDRHKLTPGYKEVGHLLVEYAQRLGRPIELAHRNKSNRAVTIWRNPHGEWRLSYFDTDGASGHEDNADIDKLAAIAIQSDYTKFEPGAVDRVVDLEAAARTTAQHDEMQRAATEAQRRFDEERAAGRTQVIAKSRRLHGRRKFQGFDISVENRIGSIRKWKNQHDGTSGETQMLAPYGYIRMTEGADGDHVDCFLGPDQKAARVYVVHTMRAPDFKQFDEDKCMLGFGSPEEAKTCYLAHYNRPEFFGGMDAMPVEEFRRKVYLVRRKMLKAKRIGQLGLPPEPIDELARWERAVKAVGIRPEDFGLVVKYARQGHRGARRALRAVQRELAKADPEMGSNVDEATSGSMGNWGQAARTAGEVVRPDRVGAPHPEFPLGRQDLAQPGRRQKRKLPRAADKLDVVGETRGKGGWARPPRLDRITTPMVRARPQDPLVSRENLETQQRGRHELQQAGLLTDMKARNR